VVTGGAAYSMRRPAYGAGPLRRELQRGPQWADQRERDDRKLMTAFHFHEMLVVKLVGTGLFRPLALSSRRRRPLVSHSTLKNSVSLG
jgi:hypothetical protein